jgi:hypothetical protein
VRAFKNKWFAKFAEKTAITDDDLREAVNEIEAGLIEADYGGDVYKKRLARKGEGKRGGYRSIVFFRSGDKIFFVYGYAKSRRDDIDEREERYYKKAAKEYFALTDGQISIWLKDGMLYEI